MSESNQRSLGKEKNLTSGFVYAAAEFEFSSALQRVFNHSAFVSLEIFTKQIRCAPGTDGQQASHRGHRLQHTQDHPVRFRMGSEGEDSCPLREVTSELGHEASVSHALAPHEISLWTLLQNSQAFWVLFSLVPAGVPSSVPGLCCVDRAVPDASPSCRHSFAESGVPTSPSASHLPKFLLVFPDHGVK